MRALLFGTFGLNHDWHFSWHGLKEISEVISSDVNLFFPFFKRYFFSFSCHFQKNKARKLYRVSSESLFLVDHGAYIVFKDLLRLSGFEAVCLMHNLLTK